MSSRQLGQKHEKRNIDLRISEDALFSGRLEKTLLRKA
jgi:hypothetical protein